MKYLNFRWLFALFLAATFSLGLKAQDPVNLVESFESEIFPPAGWTLFNNGTGNNWTRTTDMAFVSDGSAAMLYTYSQASNADTWLFSPAVSLEGGAVVEIFFDYRNRDSYAEKLKVTVGNAATVDAQSFSLFDEEIINNEFATASVTYPVPSTGTYYFAWNCYSDADKYNLAVDKIIIRTASSCGSINEVNVADITPHTADFSWSNVGGAQSYEYVLVEAGALPSTGTPITVNGTSVTLEDLIAEHEYDFYVRAVCSETEKSFWSDVKHFTTLQACPSIGSFNVSALTSTSAKLDWNGQGNTSFEYVVGVQGFDHTTATAETTSEEMVDLTDLQSATTYQAYVRPVCEGNEYGTWKGPLDFTTLPANCNIPVQFNVANITANSAKVQWAATENITRYELVYGEMGFNVVEATPINVENTATFYDLTGLESGKTYQVYLRTVCEGGNSLWLEPQVFNTDCQVITEFPYTESFDEQWNCWSKINLDGDNRLWTRKFKGEEIAATSIGSNNDYLISPQFTVGENMRAVWKHSARSSSLMTKYAVEVSTEGPNPEEFQPIDTFTVDFTSWETGMLDLRDYNGQNIYIAIHPIAVASSDAYLHINDFTVEAIPQCTAPSNLMVDAQTSSSVTLSWNAWLPTEWEIEYVTSGAMPTGTANVTNVTASTYEVTGLEVATIYDFYVRAKCSDNATSEWVGPVTKRTDCQSISDFPYNQSFDGAVWTCWSTINADNDYNEWNQSNYGLGLPDGDFVAHGSGNQNDYLITPAINVGTNVLEILWKDKVEDAQYSNKYKILVSETGNNIADFTETLLLVDCNNVSWEEHRLSLEAYQGKTIYIAFHQIFSQAPTLGFGINDFVVKNVDPCTLPSLATFSNETLNSVEIAWSAGLASKWDMEYGVSGFEPTGTPTVEDITNHTNYSLTGLQGTTSYDVYLRADCENDETSEWAGPFSFSTLCSKVTTFPYTEVFSSEAALSCWTEERTPASDKGWSVADFGLSGNCLRFDAKENPFGNKSRIASPAFDLSAQSNFELRFSYQSPTWTQANILISTDGGTSFTELATLNIGTSNYVEKVYDLADYCGSGFDNVVIAFEGTSNAQYGDSYFRVDNFYVGPQPTCPDPENVRLETRTSNSLTLAWDGGLATAWDLILVPSSDAMPAEPTHPNITENPYTFTGLGTETAYKIYVRAHCSASEIGEWSQVVWAQTTGECPRPEQLEALNIEPTTATLKWDGLGITTFDVELRLMDEEFTGTATNTGLTENTLALTGLTASTSYKFRVKAVCTDAEWSNPFTFKTKCAVYELPFTQTFDSYELDCWKKASGLYGEDVNDSYSSWSFGRFANGDENASGSYRLNIAGTYVKDWLISPVINLGTAGNNILEFDLALTDRESASPITESGDDDKFMVFITTEDDQTLTAVDVLKQWNNSGSENVFANISTQGEHVIVDLASYTGNVKILFYGESTVGSNGDNNVYIDNVSVKEMTACMEAYNVNLVNMTNNTAVINWSNLPSATKWDIKVVNNTAGTEDIIEDVTEKPYTITGLLPENSYSVFVRTDCGATNNTSVSEWTANSVDFTTLPDCPVPSDITIPSETVLGTSAIVTWNGYFATEWDLEWVGSGVAPTGTPSVSNVSSTSYTITGLDAQGQYDVYVRASCGSDWVGPVTFGSGCELISEYPWTEDFNTSNWECMSVIDANNDNRTWNSSNIYLGLPDDNLAASGIGNTDDYLITPHFQLSDDIFAIKWIDKSEWAGRVEYKVLVSTTGTDIEDFTDELETVTVNNITWQEHILSLESYRNQNIYIAFHQTSTTPDNYGFGLDDFEVYKVSLCSQPQDLASSEITGNSVKLSWTPGYATNWDVAYGVAGTAISDMTILNNVNVHTDYLLENLSPMTSYEVYVRAACDNNETSEWAGAITFMTLNNQAEMISFTAPNQVGQTTIDADAKTVNLTVTASQDITNMIATFQLSPYAKAKVGTEEQVSGQTAVDFTNPVVYNIMSEDSTINKDWTVTVTKAAPLEENDILTYAIADVQVGDATIDTDNHTVSVTVDYQADLTNLVANFTVSPSATVKVGTVDQESGVTANDFTATVNYTVIAENGTEQVWAVTVTKEAPSTETDFLSYQLNDQVGTSVIDADNHTIAVQVAWDANVSSMVAVFTLSDNAKAKIGNVTQYSGSMFNSFNDDVVYSVIAEDGVTTQDWTVSVTKQEIPQGALCTNPIPLTLDAENITGTTEGFGNNYTYGYALNGNEIVYQFEITDEIGTLSGSAEFNDNTGSISIFNGVPGMATTTCLVSKVPQGGVNSCGFDDVEIGAGLYYAIISNINTSSPTVTYTFNLSFQRALSEETDMLSYTIPNQVGDTEMITDSKKVKVTMPYGTDLSNLVATFQLSEGATAKVGGVDQVSGTTANDWTTSPSGYLNYSVIAENGTAISNWKVYVKAQANSENDILTYSIEGQIEDAVINTEEHKITVKVPTTANLNNLVASFTLSDQAEAKVNGVVQESGVTANSWTANTPVEYVVIAGNGEAQTWKVYVEKALSSQAEITEFKLVSIYQEGETVINSEEATVSAEVNENADLQNIVIFKIEVSEGATVTYDGNTVVSSATTIDFANNDNVVFVVTAEDGTVKNWTIKVVKIDGINILSASSFEVYPNPTKGIVNIKSDLDKSQWTSVEVINTAGQVVKQIAKGDFNSNIDLSSQANGLYLIRINTTEGVAIKKINLIK